jgi:hypothetical protein
MKDINMKRSTSKKSAIAIALSTVFLFASAVNAKSVADSVVSEQRAALEKNTVNQGFGPQSPRDINQNNGTNLRSFGATPNHSKLNLCNIHFHKNAEHKGGNFTSYTGNGDGKGKNTGYLYNGKLSAAQMKPLSSQVCAAKGDALQSGDTLEVHFVYSTAQVAPGPTLGACLSESTIQYLGSTTGPSYNEKASPLQVSWSVRPQVAIVDINSVSEWCNDNVFKEDHAHGVRNLVQNPKLLSPISN